MMLQGVVIDGSYGTPVADAFVRLASDGQLLATTNALGGFVVEVPAGVRLKVTRVGYEPTEFAAPPGGAVDVFLSPVGALPDLEVYPDPEPEPEPEEPTPAPPGAIPAEAVAFTVLGVLWWLFTNSEDDGR